MPISKGSSLSGFSINQRITIKDRDLILSRVVTNARALGLYMDVHVSNVREII